MEIISSISVGVTFMLRKEKTITLLFILLATPFISFLVSTTMSTSKISTSNALSVNPSLPSLTATSDPNDGEIWSSFSGLPDDTTCRPVLDSINGVGSEEILYMGSNIGLSKINIELGTIFWFISTPGAILSITPLSDVTNDNIRDVLITVDTQDFNNTELIDGFSGEKIWSFRPTVTVFVDGIGFTEKETRSWNGLQIEDLTSDGLDDVLISSYNTVYALDAIDGSLLWSASGSDDIWSLDLLADDLDSDGINEVIFGTQDGELLVVSGKNGNKIWTIQATESLQYTNTEQGTTITIDQNVYDVMIQEDFNGDNKEDVIISSESGYVSIYDITNGKLLDEVKAFSITGTTHNIAYFGSETFYNVMVFELDSLSSDTQILTLGRGTGTFGNSTVSVIDIEQNEMNVLWSLSSIDIDKVRSVTSHSSQDGNGSFTKLIIPTGVENTTNTFLIDIYSLENNTLIDQWEISAFTNSLNFDLNSGSESQGSNYPFTGNYAFSINNITGSLESEVLIFLAGYGLFALNGETGELVWRLTISAQEQMEIFYDINNDSTNDFLRKSIHYLDNWQTNRYTITKLAVVDGSTGETIWNHEMTMEDQLLLSGGYSQVELADDITGDGIPDLWLAQRETSTQTYLLQNISKVLLLNGFNGSIVWETTATDPNWVYNPDQLKIISIAPVEDQNSDGLQDILVTGQNGYLYCHSGLDGNYLWNLTRETDIFDPHYRNWLPHRGVIYNIGDLVGNSSEDILIIGDNRVVLVDSTNFSSLHWNWQNTDGWIDEENFIFHMEETHNETILALNRNQNEQMLISIFDLETGIIVYDIKGNINDLNLELYQVDFNNDGIRDHIAFVPWSSGDANSLSRGYYIIDGSDGTFLSLYFVNKANFDNGFYYMDQFKKAGITEFTDYISDINGDSIPELLFAWSVNQGGGTDEIAQGMTLELIDVSKSIATVETSYSFVPVLKEEFSHPTIMPAAFMKNLGDVSGNNKEDILMTLLTPTGDFSSIIIDSDTGLIWKKIDGLVMSAFLPSELNGTLKGNIVFLDNFGRLRAINNHFSIDFFDIEIQPEHSGKFQLFWETSAQEVYSQIFLSGTEIAFTFESEVTIYLSNGEHNVSVAITDRNGISAYASLVVVNEKGGGVVILWIAISVIVFTFVGLKIFVKVRPKDNLADFGPSLEMEGEQ